MPMLIDRTARAAALEALRLPNGAQMEMGADKHEAKALYYASLAPLVERSVDMLLPTDPTRPSEKLVKSPFASGQSGFDALRGDITFTMQSHQAGAYFEPAYHESTRVASLVQQRRGRQPIDVTMQLQSGSALAVSTMVELLEHVPILTTGYEPVDYPKSYPDIARRSFGPAWDLAMICAQQLMFAHAALSAGKELWSEPDHALRPELFQLEKIGHYTTRIALTDFLNLSPASEPSMTMQDVVCKDEATIGCPLTLRPQKFMALWNWMIDVVEERGLWEKAA